MNKQVMKMRVDAAWWLWVKGSFLHRTTNVHGAVLPNLVRAVMANLLLRLSTLVAAAVLAVGCANTHPQVMEDDSRADWLIASYAEDGSFSSCWKFEQVQLLCDGENMALALDSGDVWTWERGDFDCVKVVDDDYAAAAAEAGVAVEQCWGPYAQPQEGSPLEHDWFVVIENKDGSPNSCWMLEDVALLCDVDTLAFISTNGELRSWEGNERFRCWHTDNGDFVPLADAAGIDLEQCQGPYKRWYPVARQ